MKRTEKIRTEEIRARAGATNKSEKTTEAKLRGLGQKDRRTWKLKKASARRKIGTAKLGWRDI